MVVKDFFFILLKKIKLIFIILFAMFLTFKIIELTHLRIYAQFMELEPFSNLNVYYKGFKIGRAVRVTPSPDFTCSKVTIIFHSWKYNLPANIMVKVRRQKNSDKDYMEIIYPASPMIRKIRWGDTIQGNVARNMDDFFDDMASGDGFNELQGSANTLLDTANDATKNLTALLTEITSILKDVHPYLVDASKNFALSTVNFNTMSMKLERAINDQYRENSLYSMQNSTQNLEKTAYALNTTTIPKLNATICTGKILLENLNKIIIGLGNTLSKRMGGARIIFGTPIDNECNK